MDNRRITIIEVADEVDISFSSCQVIITEVLGMKHDPKVSGCVLDYKSKGADITDSYRLTENRSTF